MNDELVLSWIDIRQPGMRDREEQTVRGDRALQQMVRGARVRIAEFVVGIAAGPNDVFLESRRHLICRHDRAHFQAPRIVLERLGGGAGERPRGAGTHGAGEHDAASEQHAAIEQAIAGNRLWRRNFATLANGHGSSP